MQALIVAQEEDVAASVGLALRLRWPDVELAVVDTAARGRLSLANEPPDVLFLPATLSDCDALALIQEIRRTSDIPIFVVGSASKEADIAEALEAGADDYISTPISESLLVARVCAALRRARQMTAAGGPALECGDLAIDPDSHEARLKGKPLYLTPTEFKLLYHLAQHQGRLVTQQALESLVWGSSDRLYIDVLRKHMQRLRQKLESRRGVRTTITTVPRVGYKLAHKNGASARR